MSHDEEFLCIIKDIGNSSKDGYSLIDKHFKVVWLNNTLQQKGFNLNLVKGSLYCKLFDNKDEIDEQCSSVRALKSGRVHTKQHQGQDGSTYEITSIPITLHHEVCYVLEISSEVHDQLPQNQLSQPIGAEDDSEIEKKHKLLLPFKQAVHHSYDSVYITDNNHNIIYVNPTYEKISGYTAKEVLGNTPLIFTNLKKSPERHLQFTDAMEQHKQWVQKSEKQRKDGSFYYTETKIIPVRDAHAITYYYIGIDQDITPKKKEEELKIRYQSFSDYKPDPILQTDYTGMILLMGEKTKKILSKHAQITNIRQLLKEKADVIDDIKTTGHSKIISSHATFNHIHYHITAVDIPSLEAINFYFSDITEMKNIEMKMKEHNRELEQFHKLVVGRELKMIELKKKIQELESCHTN